MRKAQISYYYQDILLSEESIDRRVCLVRIVPGSSYSCGEPRASPHHHRQLWHQVDHTRGVHHTSHGLHGLAQGIYDLIV